jgi:hypothetical protein
MHGLLLGKQTRWVTLGRQRWRLGELAQAQSRDFVRTWRQFHGAAPGASHWQHSPNRSPNHMQLECMQLVPVYRLVR